MLITRRLISKPFYKDLQAGNIYKQPVFPQFNVIGFQEKTFAACVTAIKRIEPVPVQRTNNISQGIHIPIGQQPPGMRTFMGTGKKGFFYPAYSYVFSGYPDHCKAIDRKINFGNAFGDLVPGGGIVKGFYR